MRREGTPARRRWHRAESPAGRRCHCSLSGQQSAISFQFRVACRLGEIVYGHVDVVVADANVHLGRAVVETDAARGKDRAGARVAVGVAEGIELFQVQTADTGLLLELASGSVLVRLAGLETAGLGGEDIAAVRSGVEWRLVTPGACATESAGM